MTYLFWLTEFLLECLGVWFCFRKGRGESAESEQNKAASASSGVVVSAPLLRNERPAIHLLGSLLAFLAASDAILFVILQLFGSYALAWAYWYQRLGKYALLLLLACQVCGKLLGDSWRLLAGTVAILGGLLVAWTYQGQESLANQLLDAEVSAAMFLCAVICLSWITRSSRLKGFETWKAAGLLICLGSDVIFTALWTRYEWARHLYPIGGIASLAVWAWGLRTAHDPCEVRLPLSPKIELPDLAEYEEAQ